MYEGRTSMSSDTTLTDVKIRDAKVFAPAGVREAA